MALRFHFFNAVRRLAARIARLAERWAQRFEPSRSLAPGAHTPDITGPLNAIDGDEAYELVPLLNDSGEIQAGAFAYGITESQQMIELLRKEKIYGSGSVGSQSVSSAVGDFAAQLTPALATAIQAGQLMRIVGPPSVVQGLANGSMTLMRSGGHSLGGVMASGSSQLVGQARFASAAGIVAPLLVYQAVHAIVGTQQLNEINRRLANIERTLSRIVERQNARDLGEVIAAASTLQDILNEHAHSGHFNAQMQDRISHCERDLRAHLERLKILKANFHDKIQQARNKAKRRDKALELAVLIKEEGEQFGQDVRLLVALCGAVIQLEQGLMLIALEHHPESLAYREKQLKEQMKRCRETLTDMVDLSEVRTEIQGCLDEMNWWQQNLFDRSAAHVLKQAADLPLGELAAEARKEKLGAAGGGMLVWRDPDQGIQVRAIAAAAPESDTQNPPVREEDWPEAKHLALAPSSSLQVGEIYRLPITDLDVEVPIRILKQRGHGEWIGMRMDTPDIEHVEVLVDND
jgi:hypothetical protein